MPDTISQWVKNNYGSKRGLMHYSIAKTKGIFGAWQDYQTIDWNKVNCLVFVCMGNICRSPLAEAVARKHNIATRSYGLTAPNGDPADPRAISFAENHQLDLSNHTTTSIKDAQFCEKDLIIAMEPQHFIFQNLLTSISSQKTLLGLWHEEQRAYLHDPYNTNSVYFEKCETYVIKATDTIVRMIDKSMNNTLTRTDL